MLRDQVIIFMLLTNALSVAAAAYAITAATGLDTRRRAAGALVMSKANAVRTAVWPRRGR